MNPPSLASLIDQVRSRAATPHDLVSRCLQTIEAEDEQIRAWVQVDADGARRAADDVSRRLDQQDKALLLPGIPLGVKDIIDVAGMPTRAGSPLFHDEPLDQDAPVVARLKKAGAVVLGKTVTTQFACFDPPPTRNPHDPLRTPGGSSSGSAAAVATGMCPLALGSQTGGSITRPASFCGVSGLKPWFGTLDMTGIVPVSGHLDHVGPIARSVADLRVVWRALSPAMKPDTPLDEPDPPPVLAVIEQFFLDECDEEVKRLTRAALDRLAADVPVHPLDLPPSFAQVHALHRRIMAVDCATYHRDSFAEYRDQYAPAVAELIEEGLQVQAVDYAAALEHQRRFRRDMTTRLISAPVVITPATVTPAPGVETTGDPRFNSPWSYAGLPTVNFPIGKSRDGLPCGLQLIGCGDEMSLLDAAAWCETRLAELDS